MLTLIMKTELLGGIAAELFQTSHGYAVRYGLHVSPNMTLRDALKEYGDCTRHAVAAAGYFDDTLEMEAAE